MKVHAAVGADILKSINFPYPVEPIVRHHHENWNGSGYPEGLRAHDIPLGARILSVVDCYDALTSDRPYRPRYTRQHAEQVLRERRGTWYDPWVVDEFLRILDRLERMDAEESLVTPGAEAPVLSPSQLDVIAATTAEEREFNELRRDLPLTASVTDAADVLFRHLRRVIPAATLALFVPNDKNELAVIACSGVGTSTIEGSYHRDRRSDFWLGTRSQTRRAEFERGTRIGTSRANFLGTSAVRPGSSDSEWSCVDADWRHHCLW